MVHLVDTAGIVIIRRVLVVEDNAFLREMLVSSLTERGFATEGAAGPEEAWKAFRQNDPDALIMDVNLGASDNGIHLAEQMLEESPGIGLVFLTEIHHPRIMEPNRVDLPDGAAYLHKSSLGSVEQLVDVLEGVLRGRVDRAPRDDRDRAGVWEKLSADQIEVLSLIAKGMSNREIADHRGTQVRAVEALIGRTFDQLGIEQESRETNRRVIAARAFILAAHNAS